MMVVQEGHIHSAAPSIILAAIICTKHVLDTTSSIELTNTLKLTDFKSWMAIAGYTWGLGYFGAILIAFLLEGGYQGNDCIRIGV